MARRTIIEYFGPVVTAGADVNGDEVSFLFHSGERKALVEVNGRKILTVVGLPPKLPSFKSSGLVLELHSDGTYVLSSVYQFGSKAAGEAANGQ